ncbi:GNAT family N-acetyltransferase [Streptomyces sp. NPDC014846]|uniref:GNAT family N-acetyltransferase n=1 Tax=Streptomyces sp. NPDC014846 TaxID=3364922 RepID=UPI0036FBE1CB
MTSIVLKLTARDLVHADLASCGWAGSEHHLANVARQLERARTGEADYLAVCPTTDIPVAKGGVDYQVNDGVGTLWQLAVEENNPRARALYERLGYVAYDRQPDSWDEQAPDGSLRRHETICTWMRKDLA